MKQRRTSSREALLQDKGKEIYTTCGGKRYGTWAFVAVRPRVPLFIEGTALSSSLRAHLSELPA